MVALISGIYAITSYQNGLMHLNKITLMMGGFYPPLVQSGEWWRYITATLLHADPGHWFNNSVGLLIFGRELEPVLGPWSLLGLYIVSATGGLWLSGVMQPQALTIGASTIDYGLIGAYLTLVLLLRFALDKKRFGDALRGSLMFVIIFMAWNMLESSTVSLWGHVGGFTAGIVMMLALWSVRNKASQLP